MVYKIFDMQLNCYPCKENDSDIAFEASSFFSISVSRTKFVQLYILLRPTVPLPVCKKLWCYVVEIFPWSGLQLKCLFVHFKEKIKRHFILLSLMYKRLFKTVEDSSEITVVNVTVKHCLRAIFWSLFILTNEHNSIRPIRIYMVYNDVTHGTKFFGPTCARAAVPKVQFFI